MADSQRKTANICNITSSTELRGNGGGTGTFLTNNSIEVYCDGSAYWSGVFFISGSESLIVGEKYTISFTPYCTNNNAIRVQFCGVADNYTFTSGVRKTITVTAVDTFRTVAFYAGDAVEKTITIKDIQIEKGETATVYRPYSATGWQHSLRKLTTATEAVENPLYSDGTAITAYTIKGNTVQNGIPTPSNPVEVNGVGVRTENLLDVEAATDSVYINSQGTITYNDAWSVSDYISVESLTSYTISRITDQPTTAACHAFYDANKSLISTIQAEVSTQTFETPTNAKYIRCSWRSATIQQVMLNTGSTAKPFEPYGYKIPISSGGVTTNIYLGSTQTVREIKKYEFTGNEQWTQSGARPAVCYTPWSAIGGTPYGHFYCDRAVEVETQWDLAYGKALSDNNLALWIFESAVTATEFKQYLAEQYANGTPVTVWYVLATAETGTVNEPLMKIGDYADTLSNATSIPTTEGANSITVDTTVQPSEFAATWTGWHDSSVKEYDGSDWN